MADFDALKDKVVGKVKETTGKLIDNEKLEAKGKAERLKGEAKEKASDVKDKAEDTVDKATDKAAEGVNDVVDKHEES